MNGQGRLAPTRRVTLRLLVFLLPIAAAIALLLWRAPLWVVSQGIWAQLYLNGIRGHSINLDGLQLHYMEGGSGEPVVLVHGLGASAQLNWAEFMPYLVNSGHHVYAMDLLGFGESAKPAQGSYSIAEQARMVEAFLEQKHLDKVALAGESMGGWIAALVALDQPQRVRQLILFDSAGLSFKPNFDLSLLVPRTREQVDALLAILTPQPPAVPDYVKEGFIRDAQRDGWVIERALASMLTGADVLDRRFASLKMPLLIVWGKQDALTPLTIAEAMRRAAPQSVLEIYDGCGHIALQTCTDRIAPMTVNFLGGTGPQAGRRIEIPMM